MTKKIITLSIFITLLAAILGASWFFYTNRQKKEAVNKEKKVQIETVIGAIKQIGNNNILVTIDNDQAAIEEGKENDIEVAIDSKTKIEKYTDEVKSAEEFAKEQSDFQAVSSAAQKNGDNSIVETPSWYKTEIISLGDLIVGEKVEIIASKDENNNYTAVIVIVASSQQTQAADQPIAIDLEIMVSGIVDLVNETSVTLKDFTSAYPISDNQSINVLFDDKISFVLKEQKTDAEFTKEQDTFNKKIESLKKESKSIYGLTAPQRYLEKLVTKNYLKVGQKLNVYGQVDAAQAEISASKIEIIAENK